MAVLERGELQVVVPVGFLLEETQEVTVSVDRPGSTPLPVRVRLIPARTRDCVTEDAVPVSVCTQTPLTIPRPARAKPVVPDGYYELGGGD